MRSTAVTFATGSLEESAAIVAVVSRDTETLVVLDRTPFHPIDHTWPDQPADTGTLMVDGSAVTVNDAVMVARDDSGEFAVGADIAVKRGTPGWTWHVGHKVSGATTSFTVGQQVCAHVDAERRAALSRGHTACHLASLALDGALAEFWRKDPGVDPLGYPNFEARANATSTIFSDGSTDTYRIGKSLRKAGFGADDFSAALADCETRINSALAAWVSSGARSWIDAEGEEIADRRTWRCELPEQQVSFLCGGTHVSALSEFSAITVNLDLSDPHLLVMTTRAHPAA